MELSAVKRALNTGKLSIIEVGLIIPPKSIIIISFNTRIEPTRRRRILLNRAVITVSRIEAIRVKTAKQLTEIFIV